MRHVHVERVRPHALRSFRYGKVIPIRDTRRRRRQNSNDESDALSHPHETHLGRRQMSPRDTEL